MPDEINDGRVVYSASALTFHSIIRYECRYGYKLQGDATRRCGANKQWEGETPKCKEIDCGSPGFIANGYLEGRSTALGSVMHFKCNEDMTFVGTSNSTTCLDTGLWSHPPAQCMASCLVHQVEHGRVNGVAPGHRVKHGEEIKVDCKPQYELSHINSTGAKCYNGSWTHVPICVPGKKCFLVLINLILPT